jgi:ubiquinone/menaquinone biosynthesis C-methylase UbiE
VTRTIAAMLALAIGCGPSAPPRDGHAQHEHVHGHDHGHRPGHDHAHATVHHDFSDAERWSKQFDDPARDAWQKPDEVVKALGVAPGMTVVDLGAGTGYFAKRLSAAAGPTGKVVALDPEPNMVAFMRDRFQKEGLANAESRVCPTDATGLEPSSADRVLVVDTWHHIGDRRAYAKHLAEVLKDNGAVMVVDFTLDTEKGPPKQHRIAPQTVIEELASGGLAASLVEESLPDQYIVVGKKRP